MLYNSEVSAHSAYEVLASHLPVGCDTLASFVAKERPAILDWMVGSPVGGFASDEEMLLEISARRGLPVHYVPAAPAYRAAGIDRQPAFQTGLLVGMIATGFSLGEWLPKAA